MRRPQSTRLPAVPSHGAAGMPGRRPVKRRGGRRRRTCAAGLVLAPSLAVLAACGGSDGVVNGPDPEPAPDASTGAVEVATSTVAGGLDGDGFQVALDDGEGRQIAPDDTVTFDGVSAGDHTVELTGVAPECSVSGPNPAGVTAAADDTATVNFELECALRDRIVFVSTRDGNAEIYAMADDGSGARLRLTDHGARDTDPAVSPDGTRIAVSSTRDSSIRVGNDEIFVIEADGSNARRLTEDGADDFDPDWWPDGSRIVFASLRDGNGEIYVMAADGSVAPERLTEHAASDTDPAVSPDGSRIAFTSARDRGDPDIYVMEADGSGTPARLTTSEAFDTQPSWSPDGSRVAFTSDRDGNDEIYAVCVNLAQPPERLTGTEADISDVSSAWSPDGSRIAFASNRAGGSFKIFVIGAGDGSGPTNLMPELAGGFRPAWSPQTTSGPGPIGPSTECQVAGP